MTTLKRYTDAPRCPKCGAAMARSRWIAAKAHSDPSHFQCGGGADEHIDRTCERCHYEWAEEPLDSAQLSAKGGT